MADVQLTWLGHGAFRFDTPGGKRVYLDPYLDNPKCPEGEKEPERIDILALTHGHNDHVGSSIDLINQFKPTVVGIIELDSQHRQRPLVVVRVPVDILLSQPIDVRDTALRIGAFRGPLQQALIKSDREAGRREHARTLLV